MCIRNFLIFSTVGALAEVICLARTELGRRFSVLPSGLNFNKPVKTRQVFV